MFQDYYEILGVDPSATRDEIKAAYRRRVREAHPDLHPNNVPEQTAETRLLNEAYKTLSDIRKRRIYDNEWVRYYRTRGAIRRDGGDESDVTLTWSEESQRESTGEMKPHLFVMPFWRDQRVLLAILIVLLVILAADIYLTYFRGRRLGRGVLREIALGYEYALGERFRQRASERHFDVAQERPESDGEERLWELRRALQLDPSNLPAALETSEILTQLGLFGESLMVARRALARIESQPADSSEAEDLKGMRVRLLETAALAGRSLGDLEQAHSYLLFLNDIDPKNEKAALELAIVELDLNLITSAQERLESFISEYPESGGLPAAAAALARSHFKSGNYPEGIRIASAALENAPEDPALHLVLGESYFRLDDLEPAVIHLEAALPAAPDPLVCHQLLGLSHLGCGRPERAIRHFQAVIDVHRNDLDAHLGLGDAYLALGDVEAARVEYFIAAQINPNSSRARKALAGLPRVEEPEE